MNLDSYTFAFLLLAGFAALGAALIAIVEKGPFFRRSEDANPQVGVEWTDLILRSRGGILPSLSREAAAHLLIESKGWPELLRAPEGAWYFVAKSPLPQQLFTFREILILQNIAFGKSSSEIAEGLSISGETVKEQLAQIFAKLEAAEMTREAVAVRDPRVAEALDDLLGRLEDEGPSG